MKNNKLIFYWSPHIDNIATEKAAYNSVLALNKYSNSRFKAKIIDVFGEWKNSRYFEIKREIFLKLNYISFLHKFSSKGFLKSRIKYLIIFCFNFFNLKNLLEKEKPDYLIVHLVTSLPLILNLIFNFDTKLILRISGRPKLNFFRHLLWKICLKKVFKVTCPTIETFELLKKTKLIAEEKLEVLYDPILNLKDINSQKKDYEISNFENKKFFLAIGRLTRQKNFDFLINCFEKILIKEKDLQLIIIGTGDYEDRLKNLIKRKKLQNSIFLIGYQKNVFKYFEKCEAFILSSLWEDPGFVIVEAMFSNCFVLSSDCPSGPKEIIGKDNGILFKNNSIEDFLLKYEYFKNLSISEKKKLSLIQKDHLKNLL